MFGKLLVANRGEIACRIIRTARRMGIATVAVHSDADRNALHVAMADEAVHIGPSAATDSYLSVDRIVDAMRLTGADAVHPGYGFLSENSDFVARLEAEALIFVGPTSQAIAAMGDKITSKRLAQAAGVSIVPGHMGLIADADEAVRIAIDLGFPVMIKATAGGGGKGMRVAWNEAEVREGFRASQNEAAASFGDDRIFLEAYVTRPRHIEIQVLADRHGHCVHLFERECSIQRRNQKVIEEAPSAFLDPETRAAMGAQAVALAQAVGYVSAGTVEFIVDAERRFFFLEMNTRLQVEHPVTEMITGLDLVEQMLRIADGQPLPFAQADLRIDGWAMESRLYAEDPYRGFLPSTGRLTRYRPPADTASTSVVVRTDTGVREGDEISRFYDPMIAKLCTWAPTRDRAITAMQTALDTFEVEGISHNLPFVAAVLGHPRFLDAEITTAFIAEEYPDGFSGVALSPPLARQVAAAAAVLHHAMELRRAQIGDTMDGRPRRVGDAWVVSVQDHSYSLRLTVDVPATMVRFADDTSVQVVSDWRPGMTIARMTVDGAAVVLKVEPRTLGFRLRLRGADVACRVLSPRAAELARHMIAQAIPDTSRFVTCPMPGLVVRIEVAVGETVEVGRTLAAVEAMKMENVIKAERHGVVKSISVAPGDSLRVDDVILEFE